MKDTVTAGRATIEYYCSPHPTPDLDPEPALIKLIESAKVSLLVGIYSLTLPAVAAAILAAVGDGIGVRMLVDASEMTGATSQVPALVKAGVDLRCWGSSYRLMHAKVVIADSEHCGWGSYNFSGIAENDDIEIFTTATDRTLAAYFTSLIETAYAAGTVPA